VAEHVGASHLTVGRWELGIQSPLPHHREKLCRLYGKSARELGLLPEPAATGGDGLEPQPAPAVPAASSPETAEERSRRDLLAQVRRYWIDSQLEAGTGSRAGLTLSLAERPGAVDDPMRVSPRAPVADRPLPRGARIGDVHRQLGEQLLILGAPGAGKTTLLLQLAHELLAGDDGRLADPMPVVFHLESWAAGGRSLAGWLADELYQRYGVPPRLGERWIEDEQVLPLLDGLDEVAEPHRAACVSAINEFHRGHGQLPLVVCCRTAWYDSLGTRLALRAAIVICPLSRQDVRQYLDQGGPELAGLQSLVDGDEGVHELLTTPLFLTIAALTYRARPVGSLSVRGTLAERRRHVLHDYVEARLSHSTGTPAYPRERTLRWLTWLARSMRAHDQSVFYLDWIQPGWLPNAALRWLVTWGVTLLVGLVAGVLVGVNWGAEWLTEGPATAVAIGATAGLLVAAYHSLLAHESQIVPAEGPRWSWLALRGMARPLATGVAIGLGVGLLFGVVLGVMIHLNPGVLSGGRSAGAPRATGPVSLLQGMVTGIAFGVVDGGILGLLVGLTIGSLAGLATRSGVTDLAPGTSVEASGRTAIAAGAVGACVFGLAFGLTFGVGTGASGSFVLHVARTLHLSGIYWPVAAPNDVLLAVIAGGSVVGLRRGGGAYLRHRALLWLLALTGCAPRDYAGFLEHAARLVLLQRRGGGYEFVHRALLEYFAELADPVSGAGQAGTHRPTTSIE
jgi:NACHT domain-containing protein